MFAGYSGTHRDHPASVIPRYAECEYGACTTCTWQESISFGIRKTTTIPGWAVITAETREIAVAIKHETIQPVLSRHYRRRSGRGRAQDASQLTLRCARYGLRIFTQVLDGTYGKPAVGMHALVTRPAEQVPAIDDNMLQTDPGAGGRLSERAAKHLRGDVHGWAPVCVVPASAAACDSRLSTIHHAACRYPPSFAVR